MLSAGEVASVVAIVILNLFFYFWILVKNLTKAKLVGQLKHEVTVYYCRHFKFYQIISQARNTPVCQIANMKTLSDREENVGMKMYTFPQVNRLRIPYNFRAHNGDVRF